jgi:hypothetical protein
METDKRYQTMITLWFALLMSVALYFLFSLFVAPGTGDQRSNSPMLIPGLTALGTLIVVVSFPVKKKLLERSVEKQDVLLVQKALVIACAMCEASALLGLLEHFTVGNREYYFLFLLAAGGIALHFPKRSQLEAASYKSRNIVN